MSLKAHSLGSAGSAADLLTISTTTNATPIVATFAANHGLKDGQRIAVAGITGNTNANGEWTLRQTGTNTFAFVGSVGNGAHGGTPRVALIFDQTPLMKGHSAVMQIGGNLVGTLTFTAFESYAEFSANDNSLVGAVQAPIVSSGDQGVTNVNATSASSATKATSVVVLAATNAGAEYEAKLPKYLHGAVTAYTSGTGAVKLMA
jgi:hypothetical protein